MIVLALLMLGLKLQETLSQSVPAVPVSPPVDAKLHADVITFFELSGLEKKMRDSYPQSLDDARPFMQRQCPKCTEDFYREYKKRMLTRLDPRPCMAASAIGYEKYLSDKDVLELIALQRAENAGQTAAPSAELKTKLTSIFPAMMSEILGKCTEAGAKVGEEVGAEIFKEHPDYFGGSSSPKTP